MRMPSFLQGDRWIPWSFVGMLVVVAAVNAVMITVGIRTWPGLISDNYYRRGVEYNSHLEEIAQEAQLGWQVTTEADRSSTGDVTLLVEVRDANDLPLAAEQVTATLRRPTNTGQDQTRELRWHNAGRWSASFGELPSGQWDLELHVRAGDHRHRSHERIFLSPESQ